MQQVIIKFIAPVWSATHFKENGLEAYAREIIVDETRRGLVSLCLLLVAMLAAATACYYVLNYQKSYIYSSLLLVLLASHIAISARTVHDLKSLQMLGMTLLVVSGTSLVLLAQQTGSMGATLFASIALLFMAIPMVPWGLREGLLITLLIYGTFTGSMWGIAHKLEAEIFWALQYVMLGAALVSMVLVARNIGVRKQEIKNRFVLEKANKKIMTLSHKDHLTGAWNRRYLLDQFPRRIERWQGEGKTSYYALIDIDDFKPLNDTYGHGAGDKVLQLFAKILTTALAGDGMLIRMGGDEFALVFAGHEPLSLLSNVLDDVRKAIKKQVRCDVKRIGFSVGVVTIEVNQSTSHDEAYKYADSILYQAKEEKYISLSRVNIIVRQFGDASIISPDTSLGLGEIVA